VSAVVATRTGPALWALGFGNFAIGTGVLIVAGALNEIAFGLSVTVPLAGQLITAAGAILCIAAPLAAAFTSRFDRRALLTLSLGWYALGLAVSALVSDFWTLMLVRIVTVIPAAIFTPQAAAVAALLVPPERRSGAITSVFIGWSLAAVAGLPLGTWIAGELGWRATFAVSGVLAGVAAVTIAATIPQGLRVEPLTRAAWVQVGRNPVLMLVLLVTAVSASGQFVFNAYMAPFLTWALSSTAGERALLFGVNGLAGVIGNTIIASRIDRLGAVRVVHIALAAIGIGAALLLFVRVIPAFATALVVVAFIVWGFGTFGGNSAQQARLAQIEPSVTSASVALNTSGIYVGQAIGGALGGLLVAGIGVGILPLATALLLAASIAISIAAQRKKAANK
jgi:MFS transporter, DHA1 family, inner membrane transport protein